MVFMLYLCSMLKLLQKFAKVSLFLLFAYQLFMYDANNPSFISTGWSSVDHITSWFQIAAQYMLDLLIVLFGKLIYLLLLYLFVSIFISLEYDWILMHIVLISLLLEALFPNQYLFGISGDWLYKLRMKCGEISLYEVVLVYLPMSIFFLSKSTGKTFKQVCVLFGSYISFCAKFIWNSLFRSNGIKDHVDNSSNSFLKKVKKQPVAPIISKQSNLPSLGLLQAYQKAKSPAWNVHARQKQLEQVLSEFGVRGKIVKSSVGPIITLYELQTDPGVKAMRIIGLANDIARSMSALSVRIATMPGRDVLGIEVSNPHREMVYLREILSSNTYISATGLVLGLGCDIAGEPMVANLATMPHMLMAGTTGSGKSVVIHTILLSLLFKHTPETCKLILIDPKMLELSSYADIPHLLMPVVTDSKLALISLKWAVQEMERRYKIMAAAGVRNLDAYNAKQQDKIPYIVVIVDEFADLMLVAGKDIDGAIQRLAQMARAAGIHVILATQRPSVDVITGTIKANFPTRIALQVASRIDARTVLGDYGGAEQLLGKGDMLFLYGSRLERIHGPYVSSEEVEAVVEFWKTQGTPNYEEIDIGDFDEDGISVGGSDELLDKVWEFLKRTGRVSASSVQREFNIGFNRAAKCLEILEKQRKVTPPDNMGRRKLC